MIQIIRYKELKLFHIAACSLMYAGFFSVPQTNWAALILLSLCTISGIFFVYRFNDHVDQSLGFKLNIQRFFLVRLHLAYALVFLIILLPLSILYLSAFCFRVLALAGILGIVYSVNIKLFRRSFRLKHAFVFKNIAIGLAWGALVLIGADTFSDPFAQALFYFVTIQVFVGSSIRDIPDLNKDRRDGVQSLAVVLGVNPAIFSLHVINIGSVYTYTLLPDDRGFFLIVLITAIWRFITLLEVYKNNKVKRWTQSYNLLTCLLIFILVFLNHIYDIYF